MYYTHMTSYFLTETRIKFIVLKENVISFAMEIDKQWKTNKWQDASITKMQVCKFKTDCWIQKTGFVTVPTTIVNYIP